jgi:Xaa-Pro aminopeptidase
MLGFETLTLCPIDLSLVDATAMEAAEVAWLDAYHARVARALAPLLDASTSRWLAEATRPIGAGRAR